MNTHSAKRWLLPTLVSLALPAASQALIWATIPFGASTSPMMLSNVTEFWAPSPIVCRNFFNLRSGRLLSFMKVWGRSTTPVTLFRVNICWEGWLPYRDFAAIPMAVVTHPLDSQLRQYTIAVNPLWMVPGNWSVSVARDSRFGTPWSWCQGPNGSFAAPIGQFNMFNYWNDCTSFVFDLSDTFF